MTTFQPLGDQAVLASCPDEASAFHLAAAVGRLSPAWMVDLVQAYTTVAVFYDPEAIDPAAVSGVLSGLEQVPSSSSVGRLHLVPCCYELGADLHRVAEQRGLSPDEVVRLHTGTDYTVYAIGFCPGFPYLGYLPAALQGVPRLPAPRLRVEAGSVGLTGRQTGIYTEERPGGWHLIGRTPLTLVEVAEGYFPLRTGDTVRFLPVSKGEYQRLRGHRIP